MNEDERAEKIARALCEHRSIGVYPTRSWDEQPQRVRDLCFEYARIALAVGEFSPGRQTQPACVCSHSYEQHNGGEYQSVASVGRGCDECGCAWFCPAARVVPKEHQ